MTLTYLMFVVAVALSAIAAFYSIVGLTAIFAAAVVPIVIMGTALELAKVIVTVWLHEYWRQCRLLMKLYLVPAVVTLMVITSMGIFGFLSKAHLDQVVPTGDVAAQVQLIDERINNERDTIANARSLLAQLDKAVVDISNAPDREVNGRVISSAERALQVRRQQARDRANLTRTIEEAQARIVSLQEEKAPFARDLRKIEAEVGPIKYIAALIYGDNPDANLLEKAVRWVIIILVAVFDPLAIMMLLAATESRAWHRRPQGAPHEPIAIHSADPPGPEPTLPADDRSVEPQPVAPEPLEDTVPTAGPVVEPPVAAAPQPGEPGPSAQLWISPRVSLESPAAKPLDPPDQSDDDADSLENLAISGRERQAKALWKADHPGQTLKEARRRFEAGEISELPWNSYLDDPRIDSAMIMGTQRPESAHRGDVFVDVSGMPTRVYKYTGDRWIELDRAVSDRYAYDEAYITHLVERIAAGQYDPDLLTDSERQQIESRLRRDD